jgi:hypothetical protein
MIGVEDRYAAWCLDEVVARFGMALEAELDNIQHKNPKAAAAKRKRTMQKWLDIPLQYRNPTVVPQKTAQTSDDAGVG